MKELNKREIAILEGYDFNINNVEELETWTNGGVNMFVMYQDHHYNVLEAFADAEYYFDIDEEIDIHRQGQAYCNEFTIRESLEDFEDYKERLENIIIALEISAELDNFDVCTSEWAKEVMTSILDENNEQYNGYYTMLVEDMSIDDLDMIKDFDEVYTYDNKVLGLRHH